MRLLRRPIACVLLMWYLPACATYTTPVVPKTAVAGIETALVTVTAGADTLTWIVDHPWVENDSLFGTAAACQQGCDSPGARWPVPVSGMIEVQAVKQNHAPTVFLALGLVLVLATVAVGTWPDNW